MADEIFLPLNTVLLGDCIQRMNELSEKSVDLIFADPPYNLQLGGELYRPNQTRVDGVDDQWDQFASMGEYDEFTREWLTAARRILKDTGTIWAMGSYHNVFRVGAIMQDIGFWILNQITWCKVNPTPNFNGTRFCNSTETLIWASKYQEQKKYTFNYKALKAANEDVQMRSDWHLPVCSGKERVLDENGNKGHSTQKPEALLRRVLIATTNPGDVVLDPFFGSGTTGAVAKKLGRHFIGIDREEKYAKLAFERIEKVEREVTDPATYGELFGAVKPKVAFVAIVDAGLLKAGSQLRLYQSKTKPTDVLAIVHEDGTLSARGHRGSIHQLGKTLLGLPSCNGWEHWYYDTGTEELPIDRLRSVAVGKG